MESQLPEGFLKVVRPMISSADPGHDWNHVERVVGLCLKMGRKLNADLQILIPAAYLHDVINVPKDSELRMKASGLAAEKARDILKDFKYTNGQLDRIGQVIVEHSFSLGLKPTSLESQILQDADRLDALGALGIMRTVSCGTLMGSLFYNPHDPIGHLSQWDDSQFALDHFHKKLFKLPQLMNTIYAKELANERIQFMKAFLLEVEKEVIESRN